MSVFCFWVSQVLARCQRYSKYAGYRHCRTIGIQDSEGYKCKVSIQISARGLQAWKVDRPESQQTCGSSCGGICWVGSMREFSAYEGWSGFGGIRGLGWRICTKYMKSKINVWLTVHQFEYCATENTPLDLWNMYCVDVVVVYRFENIQNIVHLLK